MNSPDIRRWSAPMRDTPGPRRRLWVSAWCAVLAAAALGTAGQSLAQTTPPLGSLEVAIAAPSPTTVPLWVAVAAHLDTAHGLRVTTVTMAGGTESIQALVSGGAQAAHVGLSPVFLADAGGFHVVGVAADAIRSPFILYSRPGITSVAQLARGRVAISKVGSESDVLTRLILARHGLDIRNVYFLQMGASGQRIAGLQSGATDAAVLLSPVTIQADKAGFHRLIDYSQEFPWVFDGIVVDRGYAAQHPDRVQALVAAYVEGMYYTVAHPDVAMDVIRQNFKISDPAALRDSYETAKRVFIMSGQAPVDQVQAQWRVLAEYYPQLRKLDPAAAIDMHFARKLASDGTLAGYRSKYHVP